MIISLAVFILIEWVILLIVIPIAQRLADFSLPPFGEMAAKLLGILVVAHLVGLIGGLVGMLLGLVVFWVGLVKLFQLDVFGAIIIVVVRMAVNYAINGLIIGMLAIG